MNQIKSNRDVWNYPKKSYSKIESNQCKWLKISIPCKINQILSGGGGLLGSSSSGGGGGSSISNRLSLPLPLTACHRCDVCGKLLSTKLTLKRHKEQQHLQPLNNAVCNLCHKVFRTLNSLNNHKSIYHRRQKHHYSGSHQSSNAITAGGASTGSGGGGSGLGSTGPSSAVGLHHPHPTSSPLSSPHHHHPSLQAASPQNPSKLEFI